jgi:hypothetical protein
MIGKAIKELLILSPMVEVRQNDSSIEITFASPFALNASFKILHQIDFPAVLNSCVVLKSTIIHVFRSLMVLEAFLMMQNVRSGYIYLFILMFKSNMYFLKCLLFEGITKTDFWHRNQVFRNFLEKS